MEPTKNHSRELGEGYTYVSLGIAFAGGIVLFAGLGFLLDRWLGLLPFLTIAGTIGGSVLSFVWVLQKLRTDEERYEREHPPAPPRDGGDTSSR